MNSPIVDVIFSINTTDQIGSNQLQANDGDLIGVDSLSPTSPFANVFEYLVESVWGGNADNDIDALHILDDGRILFSTAGGKV